MKYLTYRNSLLMIYVCILSTACSQNNSNNTKAEPEQIQQPEGQKQDTTADTDAIKTDTIAAFDKAQITKYLTHENGFIAQPKIESSIYYYSVYPKTQKDFADEVFSKTTISQNGTPYAGLTQWHAYWKFRWKYNEGICRVTSVTPRLTVAVTMPNIPETHTIGTHVRNSFNRFYNALMKHEQGHMRHGFMAIRDIEYTLTNMTMSSPDAQCTGFNDMINNTAHSILNQYSALDKTYDQETEHGIQQGASITDYMN